MAKELNFELGGTAYSAAPVKLDRKKMYGWSEKVALDTKGQECEVAYLVPEESQLLPSGALKQGVVDTDGKWVDRNDLVACDDQGHKLEMHDSTFNTVMNLAQHASAREFLDNEWEQIYQLDNEQLRAAVGDNIYTFPFSYRGGAKSLDAYLLANEHGLFLLAGNKMDFAPVALNEEAVIDESDDVADEDLDELDFSMF